MQVLPSVIVARRATRDDEVADLVALLKDHADPMAGAPSEIDEVVLTVAVEIGRAHV